MKKRISILGSTGSIGTQALSVIEKNIDKFEVCAIAAFSNIDLMYKQIKKFNPKKAVLFDERAADELKKILRNNQRTEILSGERAIEEISKDTGIDILLVAVTGISGLKSVIAALNNGLCVALANKESLVAGGRFVSSLMKSGRGKIIPVDSEHSAIFQLLSGVDKNAVSRVILTATGGPFLGKSFRDFKNATIDKVLKHPRWKMGKKVSVDSATMVNKAFEMIEARWLFGFEAQDIKVVIHPQALVHSLIQLKDGSYFAHIGPTDMRIPIGYALSYPDRLDNIMKVTPLSELEEISFERVRHPFDLPLKIARKIIEQENDMGIVFNAADEVAVASFLKGRISFGDIIRIIEFSLKHFRVDGIKTITDVINFDMEIKASINKYIDKRF